MKIDSYDNVIRWSYKLAKSWVQDNLVVPKGINSSRKFDAYKRSRQYLPKNFPRKPDEYFKKKGVWQGWYDFFGKPPEFTEKLYLPYEQAAIYCIRKGIRNSIEYRTWIDRPANLPARPDQFYKKSWKGWQDFLGKNYNIPDRRVASKLKLSDVRIIKHQLALGVTGSVLAHTFGVSEMQISRIKNGENWTEV
jgi:hypothetical protein